MNEKSIQFFQKKIDDLEEGFKNGSIEAYEMFKEICFNCQYFIDAGVDVKRISELYLDTYEGYTLDDWDYVNYVDIKLDKLTLAKYIINNSVSYVFDTDFWMEFCDSLSEEGASNDLIRQLLRKLDIYEGIFFYNRIDWLKKYDDDLEPYINIFVKSDLKDNYRIHDFCEEFTKLPDEIRLQILIKWLTDEMPIDELDYQLDDYESYEKFFEETGLDVDFLVNKFLREDGFTKCWDDWMAVELFSLAPDKIDLKSVIQKITETSEKIRFSEYSSEPYNIDWLMYRYNTLKEAGADEAVIAPLLTLITN